MPTKTWAQQTIDSIISQIYGQVQTKNANHLTKIQTKKEKQQTPLRFGELLRQLIELVPDSELSQPKRLLPALFEDNFDDPLKAMLHLDPSFRLSLQVETLSEWTGYKSARIWSLIAEQKWEEANPAEMRHLLRQFTNTADKVEALVSYFLLKSSSKYYAQAKSTKGVPDATLPTHRPTKEQRAAAMARLRQNPIRPHGGYTVSSSNGSAATVKSGIRQPVDRVFRASVYIGQSETDTLVDMTSSTQERSSCPDATAD